MVSDSIQIILLFGLIGLVTNYIAWRKGFYHLPLVEAPPIALKHVISVFCIYLGAVQLLAPYLSLLLLKLSGQQPPSFGMIVTVQFVIIAVMVLALILYCHFQGKGVFAKIWKNPIKPYTTPLYDLGVGILTWFLAFPVVAIVGQICDTILYLVYNLETYEQVAVKYLKSTKESPLQLTLALISILIIAPVLEEFLFRGSLQTYLKRWFGTKAAIVLAGVCFAGFHFSTTQGLGNISLLTSLFTFACFLGYVYERQASLYASIGLHMAFNLASTLRILFLPE
jgi:uncharacterized protein